MVLQRITRLSLPFLNPGLCPLAHTPRVPGPRIFLKHSLRQTEKSVYEWSGKPLDNTRKKILERVIFDFSKEFNLY